jgi:ATP-dependent DNA helicase RecG
LQQPRTKKILNERRRTNDIPFDIQPIPGVGIAAITLRTFDEEYLPNAYDPEVLNLNGRSTEQRLAATKMIASVDNPTVTVLGILILGKLPQDYIDNSYVQFLRVSGVNLSDPIADEALISGTIPEILRRLDEKLKAHNYRRVDIAGSDTEQRDTDYPLAALQQIVRNAIMHRTYEATHAPVRITWFDDRIEVQSPGGPFGVVT